MTSGNSATTIPRATYRLQLHRDFDFDAARAVLPYLERLGISHVYCSPIGMARPGSQHGYDVIDPARINPELGGEAGFDRFAAAARSHGLGLLLDQVPNHMGVFGTGNAWWSDVLENGPASEFAPYFDIEWHPANAGLDGKLLAPVLGDSYGDVLDRGEIALVFDAARGAFQFAYYDHRFPIDPGSYGHVLRRAAHAGLLDLAQAFEALPVRDSSDAEALASRRAWQRRLQSSLAQIAAEDVAAARALTDAVEGLNQPDARDELDALHDAQAFRIASWRSASDQINYRRFFDVNELAALRIEEASVFEATHGAALDLAARGLVDGLRIDHPDGLFEPARYFEDLQQGYASRRGLTRERSGDAPSKPLYVVAEKIAAGHENVPESWAVHGTTGYRFAMVVNGLFVERRHADAMDRIWRNYSGVQTRFEDMVFECKRVVARDALGSDLTELAHAVHVIALANRRTRDLGYTALRDALADVAAGMPVYRTYIAPEGSASAQDVRFIDWALAQARRRTDIPDEALFAFLRRCLLGEALPGADADAAAQVRRFAMRFQQFSSPVAAKGIEDTAFYRYHRLVSLNEVGGDPAVFGISASAFHGASASRAKDWPHTMLATSTHDNKRAEDVRNRINVLSEQPAAWRLALRRWRLATRAWRIELDGAEAPSPADQFLLHQILLGTFPAGGLAADELEAYRERIEAYMLKAVREAKVHTRWTAQNAAYEAALLAFVRGLLGKIDGNPVVADLQVQAARIAWYGALNSLAVTALKFTSPGVPDVYQGTELIDLSLVDPDNRRPVDYAVRARLLDQFEAFGNDPESVRAQVAALAEDPTDGRLKLWISWRLLALRKAEPLLFEAGRYEPLRVKGAQRRNAIAFARRGLDSTLIVVVARRFVGLQPEPRHWPTGLTVWTDTELAWPQWLGAETSVPIDVLAGGPVAFEHTSARLSMLFATLPVAVIRVAHSSPCARE